MVMFSELRPSGPEEAHTRGLPTENDIAKQRLRIFGPLTFEQRGGRTTSVPEVATKTTFDREQYDLFRKEYEQDVQMYRLRLQRLQLRLLAKRFSGTWHQEEPISLDPNKRTPRGRISDELNEVKHNKHPLTEELFARANQLIPTPHRIRFQPEMGRADAFLLSAYTRDVYLGTPVTPEQADVLDHLLLETEQLLRKLDDQRTQTHLFAASQKGFVSEETLKDGWNTYRSLLKRVAAAEEAENWFSPTYKHSTRGQKGSGQHSKPFVTDYQRFKMDELEALEGAMSYRLFKENKTYFEDIRTFIFNSGTGALEAIITAIERDGLYRLEESAVRPVFVAKDLYFETRASITERQEMRKRTPEFVDTTDVDTLAEKIIEELPETVYLEPVANTPKMEITDVVRLFDRLRELGKQMKTKPDDGTYTYIVIDNTLLGRLATWKQYAFDRLPSWIRIISYESLVKHGEDGLELTTAASVTTIGRYAWENIENVRSRKGFTPPESTVRKLAAFLDPDTLDHTMARHARNAETFGKTLLEECGPDTFFSNIVYPSLPNHPQHEELKDIASGGGAVVNIELNWKFLTGSEPAQDDARKKIGEAVAHFLITCAREAGVDLNEGTSFGLRTTRFAIYDSGRGGFPRIRVALGTENIKDLSLITDVFRRTNQTFSELIRTNKLLAFANLIA